MKETAKSLTDSDVLGSLNPDTGKGRVLGGRKGGMKGGRQGS